MRKLHYFAGSVLPVFMLAVSSHAQPTVTRGQQILGLSYDDCLRRAQSAYSADGWVNVGTSGNAVNGFKGPNAAYIVCNPAPDTKMAVNIFVASLEQDAGVPGRTPRAGTYAAPNPELECEGTTVL